MANIGVFKKSGSELHGEIVTLSVQAKGVRILPEANRSNDNAPGHRVFVGRVEIGAAGSKRSVEGRDYLSVKLDDPSFNAQIYANLFDDEDGEGSTLIWSHCRKAGRDRAGGLQRLARLIGRGSSRPSRRDRLSMLFLSPQPHH